MYFNFKKSCSIDLKAVADEHYTKFIAVDVGGFGKQSDGGTLQTSEQYRVLTKRKLEIPEPSYLPNINVKAPFVFVWVKPILCYLSY